MKIRQVTIHNVNTIGDGTVNFERLSPLTLVRGKVSGAGASSNGAGKSSIFNAIVWCLYGREMSKRPAGNLIRQGAKECWVEVSLTLDDGKGLTVKRYRGGRSSGVAVNGKDISTATGAQDLIERKIGFTYDLFVRTVVFGGAISAFCRMQPAERTKILEEMVGIGSLLVASDAAKEKAREIDGKIEDLESAIERHEQRKRELEDSLEERRAECAEAEKEWRAHVRQCAERGVIAYEKHMSAAGRLAMLLRKSIKERKDHAARFAKWESDRKALADRAESLGRVEREAGEALAVARAESRAAHAAWKEHKNASVCPTCRRPLGKSDRGDHEENLKANAQNAAAMYHRLDLQHTKDREAYASAKKRLDEHDAAAPVLGTADKVREAGIDLTAASRAYHDAAQEDPSYRQRYDRAKGKVEAAQKSLSQFRGKSEDDAKAVKRLRGRAAIYRYWQSGFGRDGIPSLILDAVAPTLNEHVEPIAKILTDGMYTIRFENTAKGARSDFKIHVENQEGGSCYEDLSNGERTRTDLCVLFAIRGLMQERSRCRCEQIFIDELADGLDTEGVESMLKLFRDGSLARQIVYISHDPVIQDAADSTVTVVKRRGVSTITQSNT
jgi:DNA repair exonuclease SbcCD ATPase subunit